MCTKFHIVNYFITRRHQKRRLKIHQRRDLSAAVELFPALYQMGYTYGDSILNMPPDGPPRKEIRPDDLHEVDLSFVGAGDLLVLPTRPPMDDLHQKDRKSIEPGHTDLEWWIFQHIRLYLRKCSRSHVLLAEAAEKDLPARFEDRSAMKFKQDGVGAPYTELAFGRPSGPPRTALFLLRIEELWRKGPGLLAAFGMDGTSTNIWAYRLGRDPDLTPLLRKPGLTIAEMEVPKIPKRPTNLRWAKECKIETVLEYREQRPVPATAEFVHR